MVPSKTNLPALSVQSPKSRGNTSVQTHGSNLCFGILNSLSSLVPSPALLLCKIWRRGREFEVALEENPSAPARGPARRVLFAPCFPRGSAPRTAQTTRPVPPRRGSKPLFAPWSLRASPVPVEPSPLAPSLRSGHPMKGEHLPSKPPVQIPPVPTPHGPKWFNQVLPALVYELAERAGFEPAAEC